MLPKKTTVVANEESPFLASSRNNNNDQKLIRNKQTWYGDIDKLRRHLAPRWSLKPFVTHCAVEDNCRKKQGNRLDAKDVESLTDSWQVRLSSTTLRFVVSPS